MRAARLPYVPLSASPEVKRSKHSKTLLVVLSRFRAYCPRCGHKSGTLQRFVSRFRSTRSDAFGPLQIGSTSINRTTAAQTLCLTAAALTRITCNTIAVPATSKGRSDGAFEE
jgi:hypothetical protein